MLVPPVQGGASKRVDDATALPIPTVEAGAKETLPATFLLNSFLSKIAPLTNYITDSDKKMDDETESVM